MKRLYFIVLVLVVFVFSQNANAQLEKYQVTFLYNFTRLIQWPNLHQQVVFKIGVLGDSHPITRELHASAAERNVGGRPIEIVEFSSLNDLTPVDILFVPNNRIGLLRQVSDFLNEESVLIVTEHQGRMPSESIINLYVENDRMVYQIDEDKARSKKMILGRQLLNYAR